MKTDTILPIEKENISGLRFSSEDVCKHAQDHAKRDQDLLRAQSLGNLLKKQSSYHVQRCRRPGVSGLYHRVGVWKRVCVSQSRHLLTR